MTTTRISPVTDNVDMDIRVLPTIAQIGADEDRRAWLEIRERHRRERETRAQRRIRVLERLAASAVFLLTAALVVWIGVSVAWEAWR